MKYPAQFTRIIDRIYWLKVPFEDLYTSVYFLPLPGGGLLADTASTQEDVTDYILPALHEKGFVVTDIYVSHNHGDHAGGLPYLAAALPQATVHMVAPLPLPGMPGRVHAVRHNSILCEEIRVCALRGHADEMAGLYDTVSRTLISFDGLQCYGVGRYGTYLTDPDAYHIALTAMVRLSPDRIVASHDYVGGGAVAEGEDAVFSYLASCTAAVEEIRTFAATCGAKSPAACAALWREQKKLPPVGEEMFARLAFRR